jgi:hypothetical protein
MSADLPDGVEHRDGWSFVASYNSVGEAESARSALDAAQIDVSVVDENMVNLNWLYANMLGGVKLMVRDDDRDAAAMVLASLSREPVAVENELAEEGASEAPAEDVDDGVRAEYDRCPACGSRAVAAIPRLKFFIAIAIVAWGVSLAVNEGGLALAGIAAAALILAFGPSRRCTACGERWSARKPGDPRTGQAPLPDPSDLVEARCPRCGSAEFYSISYRKLKAVPLFTAILIVVVLPIWVFLPKWQCDNCGYKT